MPAGVEAGTLEEEGLEARALAGGQTLLPPAHAAFPSSLIVSLPILLSTDPHDPVPEQSAGGDVPGRAQPV